MLVDLAATKACDQIRGEFRGLRAADSRVATGTLWIRECHPSVTGHDVTFVISGIGWRWGAERRQFTEGVFTVADYDRFDLSVTATGQLTVAYEPALRTASVWFLPTGTPVIEVLPSPASRAQPGREITGPPLLDSILGALSTAIAAPGRAPEIADAGTNIFATGIKAEIPLCLGIPIYSLGTGKPFVRDTGNPSTPVELQHHGVAIYGPQRGATINVLVRADEGTAHAALVCQHDAERIANAFSTKQTIPKVHELASAEVQGEARLHVDAAPCTVELVVQPAGAGPTRVLWSRPALEPEAGTPPLQCGLARTAPTISAPT